MPASIYPASYPSWIFSKEKFLRFAQRNKLDIIAEFEDLDKLSGPVELAYCGMNILQIDIK